MSFFDALRGVITFEWIWTRIFENEVSLRIKEGQI